MDRKSTFKGPGSKQTLSSHFDCFPCGHRKTYQTSTLLAVLNPGVSAVVQNLPTLMQTLTAESWVTFGTAEEVDGGVFTVTDHSPTHNIATLPLQDSTQEE